MSPVEFTLNGARVSVEGEGSLLDALRESLGVRSVKDGCSPQGQCGCCTVWVDGQPRVSCVTPVARVRDRAVTTLEGLPDAGAWAAAFTACGASQCGFCTPGIVMRCAALAPGDPVDQALLAHLCRCTGWQPIRDAVARVRDGVRPATGATGSGRAAAEGPTPSERRAELEGGSPQRVGTDVVLGRAGFADDTAPADALVAMLGADGEWVVGETLAEARRLSGKVQGRRTTAPLTWPVELPGDPTGAGWVRTLRTTWVEPAYLEPDASWCRPGGDPVSSHGNGGAFGGKQTGEVERVARELADHHGRPVRVLYTREDVVRRGPKRPPLAAGIRADGTGVAHVARTDGLDRFAFDGFEVVGVDVLGADVAGPPTSLALRAAVWAELSVLRASRQPGPEYTVGPATALVADDGTIRVRVRAGAPLDETVLRSYVTGAAHMALSWVTSEGLSVDEHGVPHDLTIRSFGIRKSTETPRIEVQIEPSDAEPVPVSDAAFAAVATAAWSRADWHETWPTDTA